MKKHVCFTVKGKVHGVGFRFSCMEAAYRYKVTGYVKNKSDGSVYIEAEGEEENLEEFADWCRKGPVWSRILNVVEEEGTMKNYESFEIVR
ncbi:MAG: acylphosphatase [Bacteroidales bacterium]|nr:acylphosphatase [Bacteroidales bacterium]